jgi:four helix bundle protein
VPFVFERLLVYRKAVDFADRALALTERFPRGYRFLADQLNRASASIAANIAEGNGRFTKADRKHFFGIARGSIQACVPLLDLAVRRRPMGDDLHRELRERLDEPARMISGLMNGLEKRASGSTSAV